MTMYKPVNEIEFNVSGQVLRCKTEHQHLPLKDMHQYDFTVYLNGSPVIFEKLVLKVYVSNLTPTLFNAKQTEQSYKAIIGSALYDYVKHLSVLDTKQLLGDYHEKDNHSFQGH